MNYKHGILILVLGGAISALPAVAQDVDPVEAAKARNAAMEAVSPTMEREVGYVQPPHDEVSDKVRDAKKIMDEVNSLLDSVSQVGDRSDQVEVLLSSDPNVVSTLGKLLKLEEQQVANAKREEKEAAEAAERTALALASAQAASNGVAPQTQKPRVPKVDAARSSVAEREDIKPVLIRIYEDRSRPAKVILKIGRQDPVTYFVGETFKANRINYEIAAVDEVGDSELIPGRKRYSIRVVGDNGERKSIGWE